MILKLITDDLLPTDKIVLSCKETTPFCNLLGPILKRVAIGSIQGHAIYICKGSPPRPSVPLFPADMKKSPKKLGLVHMKTTIAIMKEKGGVRERMEALAVAKKEEKLKQEDPEAYKAMERDRERIQKEKNELVKVLRDVDSDDDMPLEVFCKLVAPTVVAACYTIICSEIGCWLEPRYLAKYVPILAATLCAAIPTYFGEREMDRRCIEASTHLSTVPEIKTNYISDPLSRWITNEVPNPDSESNLTHFVAKLVKIYEDKPGDLFDEMMDVFTLAPDLIDSELVLARAMYNVYLRENEKKSTEDGIEQTAEQATEPTGDGDIARAFVSKLVGLSDSSLDIVTLCGKSKTPLNKNLTTKISEALAVAATGYLPAEPQSPGSPKSSAPDSSKNSPVQSEAPGFDLAVSARDKSVAEAWDFITRHIKCIIHFSALESAHPTGDATLWKGMSHISLKLLDSMIKAKRGTVMGWGMFSRFGTVQKTEEALLLEGYKASTSNPFGGKQVDDNKGTILFKIVKTPSSITAANNDIILSPFTQLEVSSVRPNTNVSDNSFDFDMKFTKSLFPQHLIESTKREALAVSERVYTIIQKPAVLATAILGITTCVACIGPILEEKERIHQEMLLCAGIYAAVSSAVASQAASDKIQERIAIAQMDEEERKRKLEEDEKKRQEDERRRALEEQQQREKEESDRLAAEAAAAAAALSSPDPSPPPQFQSPLSVSSPVAVSAEIDWEREELEAMKRFEELFAERKKELDEYERSRIERTTKWEETMLLAIEKTATERQTSLDDKIREQEERLRQITAKATEAEELVKRIDNETDRKKALQAAENERMDLQRQQLKDDQLGITNNMTTVIDRIQKDNANIQEQLRQSAEQMAKRHSDYSNLLRTMSEVEQQRLSSIHKPQEPQISEKGASFRLTDSFAPVLGWLVSIGMTRFADCFAENELSLSSVKELTDADLEEMGVGPLGPRTILVNAIKTLKEKGFSATAARQHPTDTGMNPAQVETSEFNIKKILTDFYLKYDADKVCQVNEISMKFEGQTDRLFATLSSIYPIYFPSPYRDRTLALLKSIAPSLIPAVDILLDLHQDREIELLGDLLRVSDGLPLALSPSNTRASHIGRRHEYEVKHQVSSFLKSQNNPNPDAVAGLLTSTFSTNPDVLLQAFREVEMGEKPGLL
eukprot:TRINITY_DN6591_c0_g1_i1.p1 TRINITY_DN6591_c0_g1~~TRINITY_DN6591_c0_g1_i1.p1  ORF type:complete len:1176 (+),score=257.53 TRINITY_DN6591_c0_g1_i1:117-3644(+)